MGSDGVVKAYNELMQHFYRQGDESTKAPDHQHTMNLLGGFLLEIRKSMGNESTKLDYLQMLEWFITESGSSGGPDNCMPHICAYTTSDRKATRRISPPLAEKRTLRRHRRENA